MAASKGGFVNVYASDNMIYWDQEMTQPITQMLYQWEGESTLYVDHDFTTALQIVPPGSVSETVDENTTAELPLNQGFTRDQTLFLIDLMRQHLMKEDDTELPRNLAELNARIRMSRGKKRFFWQEIAAKLQTQFHQQFDVDKVSRKWTTLEDGYKKAVDNNSSTGKGPTKFQFFKEMGELIGGHHDVDFPVTGTAKGVTVRRPEAIKQPLVLGNPSVEEETPSIAHSSDSESASALSPPHTSALVRKRKRREDTTQVMSRVIKECEEATQRRHEEIMAEIKTTNDLFKQMLQQSREQSREQQ